MKTDLPVLNLNFDKVIIRTNSEGTITGWCEHAQNLFGYSREEILGHDISKIFPGEHFFEGNNTNFSGKDIKDRSNEVTALTKFNRKIVVEIDRSSIRNANGMITGYSNTLQYIARENTLEEKEAIIEAIVNSSNDGIVSKSLEGNITSWNPAAAKMFGYREKEVLGKHISLIMPADRLSEEQFIINQIRSGNNIDPFETIRVAKDGTLKSIELSVSPIKAKNGDIIGVSNILRDITLKKDLEEKQAILAAIVDSSDDAIISKTTDGLITSWNQSATRMFGYTEEEATGKHISIIIPPERLAEETLIIENIRKGKKVDHFETERISKDGVIRNISVTVSPIKNNKGIIIGASKTARDISSKIEAEKQKEIFTQRLKELNQYKDEFMVMASHELKTPITVILANLQILKLLLEGDVHSAFIDKTLKQMLKLSDLIGNLFEVSKIQAGKLILKRSTFDMNLLVKEVAASMQQTTLLHRIFYTGNQDIIISADNYKIEQVIVNLVSNAIKYMTEPGDIHLTIEKRESDLLFQVSDSGVGIPEKDLKNIFERFFRVSGLASSFAGSGVGLYISSEIIKAHGGKLWAESEIGKGSTFYFLIPCA